MNFLKDFNEDLNKSMKTQMNKIMKTIQGMNVEFSK